MDNRNGRENGRSNNNNGSFRGDSRGGRNREGGFQRRRNNEGGSNRDGGQRQGNFHRGGRGGGFQRGGGFNRGNGGGRRNGGGRKIPTYDPRRFINKAVEEVVAAPYEAQHKFVDFNLDPRIKKNIEKKGYVIPTPIQDQSIPHIIEGKDLIGLANTGTGKTAAFLLPLINKVLHDRKNSVLIVAPTRELAVQIDEEFRVFAQGLGIRSVQVIGGANIRRQMFDLQRPNNFVIGTPGRIKDLNTRGALRFDRFNNIVLDEVDRMLDMGFINDIKYIIEKLPTPRHSLFFSATMPNEMNGIVQELLHDPVTVSVRVGETAKSVDQDVVYFSHLDEKLEILHNILVQDEVAKALIFAATKHGAEKLSDKLFGRGFRSGAIHGDKSQSQRQRALNQFKNNSLDVLVATDVAARGLDISGVTHVINFDLPQTYEDYVHRIGRTGRGGKSGKALTFFEDRQKRG